MSDSPRVALARKIIELEARGTPDLAAAVEGTFRRMHDELATIVGRTGFEALFQRALTIARRDFEWLTRARVGLGATFSFTGVAEALAKEGRATVVAGAATLLARVMELLATFIGEDLTMRLVRRVWPDATAEGVS